MVTKFTGAKPSSVTQRGRTEPFEVQISRQDIAFHNQFEIFGFTNALGSTAAGPVWEGTTSAGGLYVPPSSAVQMTLVSSSANDAAAGTGAQQVQINGLDSNYNMLSEVLALNGTTAVTSVNSYLRINQISVTASGSGATNAGTITCKNSTSLYAQINPGIGQTQMAIYTVPNNFILLVSSVSAQTNIHYTSTVDYTYSEYNKQNLQATINMNGYQTSFAPGTYTVTSQSATNAQLNINYQTPSVRPAGTDIQLLMLAASGTGNNASVCMSGYLIQTVGS
jgi:hypothetical protein